MSINGMSLSGSSISISNGKVIVDGRDVTPDSKNISIVVDGNIDKIDADVVESILVKGDAGSVKTMSGDVDIAGNVDGNVKTMSGDVECGKISGKVNTMSGDVTQN